MPVVCTWSCRGIALGVSLARGVPPAVAQLAVRAVQGCVAAPQVPAALLGVDACLQVSAPSLV